MADFVISNGVFRSPNDVNITIDNRSFRYGDGCFETMRVKGGKIMLEELHFDRLFSSLSRLRFDVPKSMSHAALCEQVSALAEKNRQKLARVRLTVYRGDGGLYDAPNLRANYLIQTWTLDAAIPRLNENGLVLGIYREAMKVADQFSMLKSNNFLPYVMAALYAKEQRFNDCLLLNPYGNIADATIANVFVLINGVWLTPPISDGPISGVMRKYLLEKFRAENIAYEEKSITPEDLQRASEVFVTNAISGIRWVAEAAGTKYERAVTSTIYSRFIKPLFSA
ncbi:hypothetical protein EXU57_23795 [Segetibacter sp. 3557_3]|uniref:aminotransferase class IV n=1 Tax=Segetibacter sp. 3557_3 TaxID=2547429 RepID=UPI00105900D9|nr:aminotransferase class IV [Segetibacter sp. 3557_3]TDH18280.1 hypothetical protein EXU57_23795 [Segetibacter sp. 3557_3]